MSEWRRKLSTVVVGLALAAGGCVQKPVQKASVGANEIESPSKAAEPRVIDLTKAPRSSANFDVDDCAERLHDIAGEIIAYYHNKGELPRSLGELGPYASGQTTDYTCPVSHLSYVYVPDGLALAKDLSNGVLILYDAKPVHETARGPTRWGILFTEARGRAVPKADVIPISEDVMPGYVPVGPRPVVVPRKAPAGQ
jgi:hypothetical protein